MDLFQQSRLVALHEIQSRKLEQFAERIVFDIWLVVGGVRCAVCLDYVPTLRVERLQSIVNGICKIVHLFSDQCPMIYRTYVICVMFPLGKLFLCASSPQMLKKRRS
jgi:hypothetical protein